MKIHFRLATLTVFLATGAQAYQPFTTDDTGTQGVKGNQLEFSYTSARARAAGQTTLTGDESLVLTRGISDTLDLFVSTAYQRHPVSGPQNSAIGAKWRFWDDPAQG